MLEKSVFCKLFELGISKKDLYLCPGNHDLNRDIVQESMPLFEGVQSKIKSQRSLNDMFSVVANKQIFETKFTPYLEWQSKYGPDSDTDCDLFGRGFSIDGGIGVYCINTAIFSFGGAKGMAGEVIEDDRNLVVETRSLENWLDRSSSNFRILIMHHPTDWLVDWSRTALSECIERSFDLVLYGHVHHGGAFHKTDGVNRAVFCVSPPLFDAVSNAQGYSIIRIEGESYDLSIEYRQYAGTTFVPGTILSKTDNGICNLKNDDTRALDNSYIVASIRNKNIEKLLRIEFEYSTRSYSHLPEVWVSPRISDVPEFSSENKFKILSADEIIINPKDTVIKAPPQFGLSSLGRYMSLHLWRETHEKIAVFIDSSDMQNHETAIQKYINDFLYKIGLDDKNIHAIILDETGDMNERKIKNIKKIYPDIPLIILQRIDEYKLVNAKNIDGEFLDNVNFVNLFLWSLDRENVRSVVQQSLCVLDRLEENAATQRLVDDLDNLNIHRTALNCLTLLSVYNQQIDYSPNNRAEMFEKFLTLIFQSYKKNPDYSTFPDMKDALNVLGMFSELVIRKKEILFSKEHFLSSAISFCDSLSLSVDCHKLLSILIAEKIVIRRGQYYSFRYLNWVYFFAAHRMHHDGVFREFMLKDKMYMNAPEVVEFYSGIDRRRSELIDVLINDMSELNEKFEIRTGINSNFQPFDLLEWRPKEDSIKKLKENLIQESNKTSLPDTVKDRIADRSYDRRKPYNQDLQHFLEESSLAQCRQVMMAAARALRNSDYVSSERKSILFNEITRSWAKWNQVLFLLSPVLANRDIAQFEDVSFKTDNSFDVISDEDMWYAVLSSIPQYVVFCHDKDVYSPRMLPLFVKKIEETEQLSVKFMLVSLISHYRPQGWNEIVRKYVITENKNSYYLSRLLDVLRFEYRCGFVNESGKKEIFELMSVIVSKHNTGAKNPNKKLAGRMKSIVTRYLDIDSKK